MRNGRRNRVRSSPARHADEDKARGAPITIISASTECEDAQSTVRSVERAIEKKLMNDPGTRNAKGEKQETASSSRDIEKQTMRSVRETSCIKMRQRGISRKGFCCVLRRERAPHFLGYGTLIAVLFTIVRSLSSRYFRNLTCRWRRSHLQPSGIPPNLSFFPILVFTARDALLFCLYASYSLCKNEPRRRQDGLPIYLYYLFYVSASSEKQIRKYGRHTCII